MSALPPKADKIGMSVLCQKRPYAAQQKAPLFDDFVCLSEQRRRKLEAERLGGRKIYDEIKLSRLLDWDVARLGTRTSGLPLRRTPDTHASLVVARPALMC